MRPAPPRPAGSFATSSTSGSTRTKRTAESSTASSRPSPAPIACSSTSDSPTPTSTRARRPPRLPAEQPSAIYLCGGHRPAHRHPRRDPEEAGDGSGGVPGRLGHRVLAAARVAERRGRRRPRHYAAGERAAVLRLQHVAWLRNRRAARGGAGLELALRPAHSFGCGRSAPPLLAAMDAWVDGGIEPGHHLPARGGRYAGHRRGCACRFSGDSRDAIPWIAEPSRAARLRSGVRTGTAG